MMELPSPPPPTSWPLPLVTPVYYNSDICMNEKVWVSKYSRPNFEDFILFPTQFPTSIVGYNRPYGSFGVECYSQEYQHVKPTILPQYQVRINGLLSIGCEVNMVQIETQIRLLGLARHETGVFHAPRVLTEYNGVKPSTNFTNIREWRTKEISDIEGKSQNQRNKNDSQVKNDNSIIKAEKEEFHDRSLPPGVVLPMEWTY